MSFIHFSAFHTHRTSQKNRRSEHLSREGLHVQSLCACHSAPWGPSLFLSTIPSHHEVGIADRVAQMDKLRLREGHRLALRHTAELGLTPRLSDVEVRSTVD